MMFRVLGGIAVQSGGEAVAIGGPRQRVLLGCLLAHAGRPVSLAVLMDAVWDGVPPDRAERTLQTYVSKLRKAIGGDRIVSSPVGLTLTISDSQFDASRYDALVSRAREALDQGDIRRSSALSQDAETLWRGAPFGDLGDRAWCRVEVTRLRGIRTAHQVLEVRTCIESGRPEDALSRVGLLLEAEPLSEEFRRLELVARRRVHGPADAVRALDRYRSLLIERTGLEPSAEFEEFGRALREGEALSTATTTPPTRCYRPMELIERRGPIERWTCIADHIDATGEMTIVRPPIADDPVVVRSLAHASRGLMRFTHSAHVPLLDVWREHGAIYVVHGGSRGTLCAEWIEGREGRDVLEVLSAIASVLLAAAADGQLHGALDASSVRVHDGRVSLVGIGVQQLLGRAVNETDDARAFARLGKQLLGAVPQTPEIDGRLAEALEAAHAGTLTLVDVHRTIESVLGPRTPSSTGASSTTPYVGLAAFDEHDSRYFFGRSLAVDTVVARLSRGAPFIVIVGPSGAGKSSIARAGVLPAIRRQRASDEGWIVRMEPGSDPVAALETALRSIETVENHGPLVQRIAAMSSDGGTVNLLVDQLEELFTLAHPVDAQTFVDELHRMVHSNEVDVRVVATLRSDFFDEALRWPRLGSLCQDGIVPIRAMEPGDLEAAITQPARLAGGRVDAALVSTLLADTSGATASLPLLQFCLSELWREADRSGTYVLTLDAYERIGGLMASLAARAEALHDDLDDAERSGLRRFMRRLVHLGYEDRLTRRRTQRADVPASMKEVIEAFIDARLLTTDTDPFTRAPTIEIAHEALFDGWPRLRQWIDEDLEHLRLERVIAERTHAWVDAGRDDAELIRGARLASAVELVERGATLSADEHDLIEASTHAAEAERAAERAVAELIEGRNRRLGHALRVAAVLLVTALAAAIFAIGAQGRERDQRLVAEAERTVADARRMSSSAARLVETNRETALLLAVEAHRRDPGPESLGALHEVLVGLGSFLGAHGSEGDVLDVDWVGASAVVALSRGTVELVDLEAGTAHVAEVQSRGALASSSNSALIAVADLASGVQLFDRRLTVVAHLDTGGPVGALAFSPDGTLLAAGTERGTLELWSVQGQPRLIGTALAHPETDFEAMDVDVGASAHEPLDFPGGVADIAFDQTGTRVATAGGVSIRVHDLDLDRIGDVSVTRPRLIESQGRGPGRPTTIRWVSDDTIVAATESYLVEVDAGSMRQVGELRISQQITSGGRTGFGLDFHDGMFVLGLPTGVFRTMEVDSSADREVDLGDELSPGGVPVSISPTGETLAVAGSRLRVFSLDGRRLVARAVPLSDPFEFLVSNDGTRATSMEGQRQNAVLVELEPLVSRVEFGAAGRLLLDVFGPAAFADARGVHLLDADDLSMTEITVNRQSAWSGLFDSSDNRFFVGYGQPGPPLVELIDVASGEVLAESDYFATNGSDNVVGFALDPGGEVVVIAASDGRAAAFDAKTLRFERLIAEGNGQVTAVRFSPTGDALFTAGDDGVISERDGSSFRPRGREFVGATSGLQSYAPLAVTPDGSRLVANLDGRPRVFDVATGMAIGQPLPGDPEVATNVSSDGRYATSFTDGYGLVWDLDPSRWIEMACDAAGRNLTAAEWVQFGVAEEPVPSTCPAFPVLEPGDP